MKIEKVPIVKLILFAKKIVRDQSIADIKALIGDDNKTLVLSGMKMLPKDDELLDLAQDWLNSPDGMVQSLVYSIQLCNKDAKDEDVKNYVENLSLNEIVEKIKIVRGVEEVAEKKE